MEKASENQRLHRKAALTIINEMFKVRDVDDRKGWFK
jgi:hypothetical protein